MDTRSGDHWVAWANIHARNSNRIEALEGSFRRNVETFVAVLESAGARVDVSATRRSPKRAYLFHWSWKIANGKCRPADADAAPMAGVGIRWDHGNDLQSRSGALEMTRGFGLAMPPRSIYPPALTSNHIAGRAIDMDIRWKGTLRLPRSDGGMVSVAWTPAVNANLPLHGVGASYGVRKLRSDAPHWSFNGR
ncbi:hypothetical protein ACKVMH_00955 [Lysobacter zhanggongensis]|uniref:D-alanyl-D-alanine carboxypeptidase n=1 Tax=Lysobacter zhanggongensis TaxID=1774951 RepID=A0ABU7YLP1_9GAMM